MIWFMMYIGVVLAVYFGGAYFMPDTVKNEYNGYNGPPWIVISLLFPISLIAGFFVLFCRINNVIVNAGLKRQERILAKKNQREWERLPVDQYFAKQRVSNRTQNASIQQEAEQEVEEMLQSWRCN